MAQLVDLSPDLSLGDYEAVAHLAPAVRELQAEAAHVRHVLDGRTVWMINSTAQGGGVAEMLPAMVSSLCELGVKTRWAVIETQDEAFFALTKRLHNMIHGAPGAAVSPEEKALYDRVNRDNAAELLPQIADGDILVVHDPQPMGLASILREQRDLVTIWRCHIGLDSDNEATRAAWDFLRLYGDGYERAVFSAPEYIPEFLSGRSSLIYPAIDPLSPKNEELHLHRLVGILSNAALVSAPGPVLTPPFDHGAERMLRDGNLRPANLSEDIGLLSRPIITQVSRWDRLKGFVPLMRAFQRLKLRIGDASIQMTPRHRRRLKLVRLVLAGPDPSSIQDDPEGLEVIEELKSTYMNLDAAVQDDVAVISLPMTSRRQNALMVNALQRASSIVVQNSLREGFGLTIAEAMWKRLPVLSNSLACGPRQQVRDELDGRLIHDPEDTAELATAMDAMLADQAARSAWGRNAQRRVHEDFLLTAQLRHWMRLIVEAVTVRRPAPNGHSG